MIRRRWSTIQLWCRSFNVGIERRYFVEEGLKLAIYQFFLFSSKRNIVKISVRDMKSFNVGPEYLVQHCQMQTAISHWTHVCFVMKSFFKISGGYQAIHRALWRHRKIKVQGQCLTSLHFCVQPEAASHSVTPVTWSSANCPKSSCYRYHGDFVPYSLRRLRSVIKAGI